MNEGLVEFFTNIGMDVSNPKAIIEIQKDISFLRRMRMGTGSVVTRVLGFLAVAFLGAIGTLLTLGISESISKGG